MHSGSVQNEAGLRSGAVQGLHLINQAQAERGLVSEMSLTSVSAEKMCTFSEWPLGLR